MISFPFPVPVDRPLEALCLGAHADDIEIGCGGTLLTLLGMVPVRVRWVVFSGEGKRADEAARGAERFLGAAAESTVQMHDFPDGYMPAIRAELKDAVKAIAAGYERGSGPDLVFTHDEADLHQDHALLGALTRETFRDHLVLGYEIPKVDGGLRSPNVYVPLEDSTAHEKVGLLLGAFPSQRSKHWFDPETFLGLMRLRGVECASPGRYAEGFHARKVVLGG